jgi:hypothetical protein
MTLLGAAIVALLPDYGIDATRAPREPAGTFRAGLGILRVLPRAAGGGHARHRECPRTGWRVGGDRRA